MARKNGILDAVAAAGVGALRVSDKRTCAADLLRPPTEFLCREQTSVARGQVVAPTESPRINELEKRAQEAENLARSERARVQSLSSTAIQFGRDVAEARLRFREKSQDLAAAEAEAGEIARRIGADGWNQAGRPGWNQHWLDGLGRTAVLARLSAMGLSFPEEWRNHWQI